MKFLSLLAVIALLFSASAYSELVTDFAPDVIFDAPESVHFVEESNAIFISNVAGDGLSYDNNGWITKTDRDGKNAVEKWVSEGLHAPKGMRAHKGILYVADINNLVLIDIDAGKIITIKKIEGSVILNDVAISTDGTVYVSDTMGQRIYKMDKDGMISILVEGEQLESPNGLLVDGDSLIVAAWGKGIKDDWSTDAKGSLFRLNLKSLEKTMIVKELGQLDGIEIDPITKNIYTTDWVAGVLYEVEGNTVIEETTGFLGAADIAFQTYRGMSTVLVPNMSGNVIKRVTK